MNVEFCAQWGSVGLGVVGTLVRLGEGWYKVSLYA